MWRDLDGILQVGNEFHRAKDRAVEYAAVAGDLNSLSDAEVVFRTGLASTVNQPTRGNTKLDRLYVSDLQFDGIKVVKSTVKSDHMAIVAYRGSLKKTVGKTRRTFMFSKHSPKQHAFFLSSMAVSNPINFNLDDVDPQASYNRLYDSLLQLLDKYYSEYRFLSPLLILRSSLQ